MIPMESLLIGPLRGCLAWIAPLCLCATPRYVQMIWRKWSVGRNDKKYSKSSFIWKHGSIVALQPQVIWPAVGAKHKDLRKLLIALNKIKIWERIKKHLEGHSTNLSLDIAKLKEQIFKASQAHLTLMPGTGVLKGAADKLAASNPLKCIKTLGNSVISMMIVFLIYVVCLCIVCRSGSRLLREVAHCDKAALLSLCKSKKGDMLGASPPKSGHKLAPRLAINKIFAAL